MLVVLTAYWALGSQAALDYVVRRAVAAAEGHLTIEGAEGSLLSTVRIARIAWQGDEMNVEASETAVAWSPIDLVSRKLVVQGLGAKRLSLEFKKTQKAASGLPASLALPLEVDVRNIGVERLEWKTARTERLRHWASRSATPAAPTRTRSARFASSPTRARFRAAREWAPTRRTT